MRANKRFDKKQTMELGEQFPELTGMVNFTSGRVLEEDIAGVMLVTNANAGGLITEMLNCGFKVKNIQVVENELVFDALTFEEAVMENGLMIHFKLIL